MKLLDVLPLQSKVLTGDAMGTHRDVAEEIRRRGGDNVLMVQDNQLEVRGQYMTLYMLGKVDPNNKVEETRGLAVHPEQAIALRNY